MDPTRQAMTLQQQGQPDKAIALLRRALRKKPADCDCNHLLAILLTRQGHLDQALFHVERAIQSAPTFAILHNTLGATHLMRRDEDLAIDAFREALRLDPDCQPAATALGSTLISRLELDEADAHFDDLLERHPELVEAALGKGLVALAAGDALEADRWFAKHPDHERALDNRCLVLNDLDVDPEVTFETHRRYAAAIDARDTPLAPTNPDPDRPLRVGFLSADLRRHSVAFFLEPLVEAFRDRDDLDVTLFSATEREDQVTDRLRKLAAWRDVRTLTDDALRQAITHDRIDVLVELGGHTTGSRLRALARRVAPVVVTWLGYPGTTGLPTIDWRLVDARTDPIDAPTLTTESLHRIDRCFLCYRPPDDAPDPDLLPGLDAPTFASFNNASKLSDRTLRLWARLLDRVDGARMLLKASAFGAERARARVRDVLGDRVEFLGRIEGFHEHLETYRRVHVALDPMPYNGTTTTCEALLMGVPVVTCPGTTHASRVGASLLEAADATEGLAHDEDDYLDRAIALLDDDTPRSTRRQRLEASALRDEQAHADAVADAFRAMWRHRLEST